MKASIPQIEKLTTDQKALAINLDQKIYGTFAEIGAGQEVARHFFQVGGAAGTIAKSMSAYDMKFSDAIYGKAKRYVSRERLGQMMEHEYQLLTERLQEVRGERTCFFVYANTVAAASFKNTNDCHGWMGIRFQLRPQTPPNEITIHVRMWDKTALAQQDALGMIGVNLVYGAMMHTNVEDFIYSLADNLGIERIEVDMLEIQGPDFIHVENRAVCLHLVKFGLTNAIMYGPDRHVLQPSEALYKKPILVERGSFRPVTNVNVDMLECAGAQFLQEEKNRGEEEVMVLMELTLRNILADGELHLDDFLARVDTLAALGHHVLISNYSEFFRLTDYFRRYTKKMVGIVLGINNLLEVFNEQYYENLPGGILEACGRLFKEGTKMYVYPMKGSGYTRYLAEKAAAELAASGQPPAAAAPPPPAFHMPGDWLITAQNVQVKIHLRNLYAYLLENHYIESVAGFQPANLDIFSRDVLKKIIAGDPAWEKMVPPQAAAIIKERRLWNKAAESAATPTPTSV
ncbi:MAG: TonB-dependent receptor [Opitutales bacterium]|jgi:hypothetical protein